jgi:phenylpyruvate tautomerase PptA (4-oxalocrotonate tautomerase family)
VGGIIMAYVNSIFTSKLSEEKKELLKSAVGQLITIFPGKSEDWLFVSIEDQRNLYFKGIKATAAAIIEIKIFGKQDKENKDLFTSKLCDFLENELSIKGQNVFFIFTEAEDGNWGWNGGLF